MTVPGYNTTPAFMPPGVVVRKLGTDQKGRFPERVLTMDLRYPSAGLCYTHNNSVPNILRGLGERLMMVPVEGGFALPPAPSVFDLEEYRRRVLQKMPKYFAPLTHDEFVMLYDGPKRKRYAAAAARMLDKQLESRDFDINVFIKDETVCTWAKVDPAPRLISPRSPEYCLELGCYIKPIEHLLYKAVARVWGEVTIAKGLNFNERGALIQQKWESFDDPVAVGLDASRFDQHVSVDALKWEHSVYLGCYPKHKKRLAYLLSKQLVNHGKSYVEDMEITYTRNGGRMSGDMNTALGNCLIMTGLVWKYLSDIGVHGKLINDGDDCVVFIERKDLELFQSGLKTWFLARGFNMKVEEPAFALEEIEFCQCHPVYNGEQYTMCRNVTKALFTDVVHVGRTPEEIASIRSAVGLCGLAWSRGIPVFQSFYRSMDSTHKPAVLRNSGTYWNSIGCKTGTTHISDEARLSFQRAFGVSPHEQSCIEDLYAGIRARVFDDPQLVFPYNSQEVSTIHPLFICESLNHIIFDS